MTTMRPNYRTTADAGVGSLSHIGRRLPRAVARGRWAAMKIIAKIGLIAWLLPLLLSGCASHTKCKTLIPVATYKLSNRENVDRVGYQTLYAHRIILCGAIVDENTGECWIVVDPDKVGQAKKILRSTLSGMSPEQRGRAFKVLD